MATNKTFLLLLWLITLCSCGILNHGIAGSAGPDTTSADTALRQNVVDHAKKYLGSKYKYAGKSPQGFDCSGFTHYVMEHFDITLSPSSRFQAQEGKPTDWKESKPGDLIFFRRSAQGPVFHVAMVVENEQDSLKVIHSTSRGVVIDNLLQSSYWKPKISSARDVISK